MVFRRLNRNTERQASIECGQYTLQYLPLPHSNFQWTLSSRNPCS